MIGRFDFDAGEQNEEQNEKVHGAQTLFVSYGDGLVVLLVFEESMDGILIEVR